jgi:hypothetical protein
MYTFSCLGSKGRLGNQMFQYATLLGVGIMNEVEIAIPTGDYALLEAFPGLAARKLDRFNPPRFFEEAGPHFDPTVWLAPDGTDYYGYFQSPYYFNHCEEQVRKEFVFAPRFEREAADFLGRLGKGPLCAVHVRRTDYLTLQPYYHILTMENYYAEAMQLVRGRERRVTFLVFSDDLDHCKATFPPDVLFSNGSSEFLDLWLMSKCQFHVIANSSFSWWGAWLAGSATVVAPKKWFARGGEADWETVYCPHWVRL